MLEEGLLETLNLKLKITLAGGGLEPGTFRRDLGSATKSQALNMLGCREATKADPQNQLMS